MSFRLKVENGSRPEIFVLGEARLPGLNGERPASIHLRAENLDLDLEVSIDEPLPLCEFDVPIEWGDDGYSLEVTQFVSIILRSMRENREFCKVFPDGAVELKSKVLGRGMEIDSDGYGSGRTFHIPGLGKIFAT